MFAGRDVEIRQLTAAVRAAAEANGGAVVIVGDAGVGKSALAREAATHAASLGAAIHWARCVEIGGAPAFWPWAQLVRSVFAERDLASDGAATVAALLLPEADTGSRPTVVSDEDRFRFFDATARLLEDEARTCPLVLVMEDCHVADVASLELLRFVILAGAGRSRWLFVLTQRETPADDSRTPLLAEIRSRSTTISLGGLGIEDLDALVRETFDGKPPKDALARLHDATAGNPLFAIELARHVKRSGVDLLRAGDAVPLPASVRDVLAPRLAQFGEETRRRLALLAAAGRVVEPGLCRRLLGQDFDDTIATGLREEWLETSGGGVQFVHSLMRAALLERLTAAERQAVHEAVGEALETTDHRSPSQYAALAHHFRRAGPQSASKALDYARRAGDHARGVGAFADAATHFCEALNAGVAAPVDRCELLIASGACKMRAGHLEAARAECKEAWELAAEIGAPHLMGEAALAFATFGEGGIVNEEIVRLITGALSEIGDADPGLRARLRGRLASEIVDPLSTQRRQLLAQEAAEEALATREPRVIVSTLRYAQSAASTPDNLDLCLTWTTAALEAAEAVSDIAGRAEALAYRSVHRLIAGDADGYRADVARLGRLAEQVHTPYTEWVTTVAAGCRSLLEGQFDAAERHIAASLNFASTVPNALASWQFQDFSLTWERGDDLSRFEPILSMILAMRPTLALMTRSAVILVQATSGREHEAEAALLDLAGEAEKLKTPWVWLLGVGWLAESATILGSTDAASILRETLTRYQGLHVVGGTGTVAAYWGSVDRHLGNLSLVLEDADAAVAHSEAAFAAHAHVGSVPFMVRSQLDVARALLSRAAPGDVGRANDLLQEASAVAERLGMRDVAAATRREQQAAAPSARAVPLRETHEGPSLVREGDYWTFSYGGSVLRLRDSKGVVYLAELLREPGREVLALDLAGARRGDDDLSGDVRAPVLDERARSEYRRRLTELEDELVKADQSDVAKVAKLQDEWDFLVEELKAATGIAGRSRTLGTSPSEAARIAVTKAIRGVLKKIDADHPELGRHLKATIRTGTFCAYRSHVADCVTWRVGKA